MNHYLVTYSSPSPSMGERQAIDPDIQGNISSVIVKAPNSGDAVLKVNSHNQFDGPYWVTKLSTARYIERSVCPPL